mmetsp:Transcript_6507/g.16784  ORF Transcript_6507/g.16784 Transcript_6507/m.16784 type:complete len:225 (+) Transcript_6507:2268-2942(+)
MVDEARCAAAFFARERSPPVADSAVSVAAATAPATAVATVRPVRVPLPLRCCCGIAGPAARGAASLRPPLTRRGLRAGLSGDSEAPCLGLPGSASARALRSPPLALPCPCKASPPLLPLWPKLPPFGDESDDEGPLAPAPEGGQRLARHATRSSGSKASPRRTLLLLLAARLAKDSQHPPGACAGSPRTIGAPPRGRATALSTARLFFARRCPGDPVAAEGAAA